MWMHYTSYPVVEDLESGVQYLRKKFEDLRWDVDHQSVYNHTLMTPEEFQGEELKYRRAVKVCDHYLDRKINLRSFCRALRAIKLGGYLHEVKKFLPDHYIQEFGLESEEEEYDEEESPLLLSGK